MKPIHRLPRTTIFFALAVTFIAVQSIAAAGFLSLLHFRSATHSVSHAHAVLLELETMGASLTKAETGQRGYVITGAEHFLLPYRHSVDAVRGHLRRLVDLTQNSTVQQHHVAQLVRQVDERMNQLGETIVARHVNGFQAAGDVLLANYEKATMDSIQRTIEDMRVEESDRLRSRTEESATWAITAGALSVIMFLLMFVVFGFSFVVIALALAARREPDLLLAPSKAVPPLG
jgi:CHASE3 domain sensor protein